MGDPGDQPHQDIILNSTYAEEELLDQPFLLPDGAMINYDLTREDYQSPHFSVSVYPEPETSTPAPIPYWENCTASLEEVQTAIFTGPAPAPGPGMELQSVETRTEAMNHISRSIGDQEVTSSDSTVKKKVTRKSKKKSAYKHIPHREKPAHLVEKRNARERRRVEAVNTAFLKLRRAVPVDNKRGKRVSKVKILTRAIDYILNMKDAIDKHDGVRSQFLYDDRDDDHLFAF